MKKVLVIGVVLFYMSFCSSCASSNKHVNISITKCDSWEKIRREKNNFIIKNNGITSMELYSTGSYVINAELKNGNEIQSVKLIVDTGSIQNLLSTKVIKSFNNISDSGNTFILNGVFVDPGTSTNSKGYIFDSLESEGFISENIMFQEIYRDNCGETVNGEEVDGIIGMDILRCKPFKLSSSDKTLTFFETSKNFPKENKIKLNTKKLPFRLESKINFDKQISSNVHFDTGALETYLYYKKFSKLKKLQYVVKQKYQNIILNYALLPDFEFANKKIPYIPICSNQMKLDFSAVGTLGLYVIRNFDLYVDVSKEILIMEPKEHTYPKKNLSFVVGGDYVMNGVSINKQGKSDQYKITMIATVNDKPVYDNIKLGDQVLTINGLSPDKIDWDKWYDIKSSVLCLKRDDLIFEETIWRHEFIFSPEF